MKATYALLFGLVAADPIPYGWPPVVSSSSTGVIPTFSSSPIAESSTLSSIVDGISFSSVSSAIGSSSSPCYDSTVTITETLTVVFSKTISLSSSVVSGIETWMPTLSSSIDESTCSSYSDSVSQLDSTSISSSSLIWPNSSSVIDGISTSSVPSSSSWMNSTFAESQLPSITLTILPPVYFPPTVTDIPPTPSSSLQIISAMPESDSSQTLIIQPPATEDTSDELSISASTEFWNGIVILSSTDTSVIASTSESASASATATASASTTTKVTPPSLYLTNGYYGWWPGVHHVGGW